MIMVNSIHQVTLVMQSIAKNYCITELWTIQHQSIGGVTHFTKDYK